MNDPGKTRPSDGRFSVLLIEDDSDDVELMRMAVARAGISVELRVARDGESALAALREGATTPPDIVLLDLNLPGIPGLEVLRSMRTEEPLKRIPVVVFSTSSHDADVDQSYSLGANCFISKPSTMKDFVRIVEAVAHFWFEIAHLPGGRRCGAPRAGGGQP